MSEVKAAQCPDCKITYFVTTTQLAAAKGNVRCGVCLNIFDAVANAAEYQPEDRSSAETADISEDSKFENTQLESMESSEYRRDEHSPVQSPSTQGQLTSITSAPGNMLDNIAVLYPDQQQLNKLSESWQTESLPAVIKSSSPVAGSKRKLLFVLLAVNILALLVQLLFFYSAELSLNEGYRPIIKSICEKAGCPISQQRNINLIHGDALVIRDHPETSGALEVEFILTNRATFPQAFPNLSLKFTDLDNRLVAQRIFEPLIYLRGTLTDLPVMAIQKSYRIKISIMDPGAEAISYSLIVTK